MRIEALARVSWLVSIVLLAACNGGSGGGTGPGGNFGHCEPPPASAPANALAALSRMNDAREAMGSTCVTMIESINTAARLHCEYYSMNSGTCTDNPHSEVSSCSGFVAESFADRMSIAGYSGAPAAEVMNFVGDGRAAVDGWIDSIWHRVPVLSPWVREAGYGGTADCDTMDFGVGQASEPNLILTYPYDGQTDVPTTFDGQEGPAPPAPPGGFPSGFPISLHGMILTITDHTLFVDGQTTPIAHVWVAARTPEAMGLLQNEFFMYANTPLAPRTHYKAHFVGRRGGAPLDVTVRFTTQ